MQQSDRVVVVGAGPAGVGVAVALKDFGVPGVGILDRHGVGSSFKGWPSEMRLITPSFNTTPFGILDLNAICLDTSVANFLGVEHPTGKQYARYLRAVVSATRLPVLAPCDVLNVSKTDRGGFRLETSEGSMETGHLIWAAGEFQYPRRNEFPGSEHCIHNATINSYRKLPGNEHIVIGAFESGVDAAVNLTRLGRTVDLIDSGPSLATSDQDPSRSLSPFTRKRLAASQSKSDLLSVHHEATVAEVEQGDQGYIVRTEEGTEFYSSTPPIRATGFRRGTEAVRELFDYREDGEILLTEEDESTIAPGLFLTGPLVRHDHHIFCYIYKFRQRFAIVANTIANRLGIEVPDQLLEEYERNQMLLADLSCCGQECVC